MGNHPSQEPPEDSPRPPGDFWSGRRWLARLSFSFLIIAVYLAYIAYKGTELGMLRKSLLCVGAAISFALFLVGTREKHRPGE